MPIYMDRHDVSDEVTAEHVAQLHREDLKVQHKFNCKGLTYWFDGKRKTAFCLVEAPNKEAIQEMHDHAHGEIPHMIIEVDSSIVESFLGRIEDPKKSKNTDLNIINDPAFRTIMVADIRKTTITKSIEKQENAKHNIRNTITTNISAMNGRLVKHEDNVYLVSFDSVSNAIASSLEILEYFKNSKFSDFELKIGLYAGVPVTEKQHIFEDTIKMATYFSDIANHNIVISHEVRDLFESENQNHKIANTTLKVLDPLDEKFLTMFMDFINEKWTQTDLNINSFCKFLGYSKSKLYRQMIMITGKSPNTFLKDYRLNRALKLLTHKTDNISEIAFKTGFNSPAYFSKCFVDYFGILPSKYLKKAS